LCVTCEAGKFASANQDVCNACPQNTYCESGIQKTCVSFRPNTYNPSTASSSSSACLCVAGRYLLNSVCVACVANNFCTGQANSMTACPLHSQSLASSQDIKACECRPGYDGENGGPCTVCVAGTFKVDKGNVGCEPCGIGKFSAETARSIPAACLQCPLGTASPNAIAASCPACNAGTYSDTLGATICKSCQVGKWSSAVTAVSSNTCQWCGPGKYQRILAAPAVTSCLACPAGKTKTWQ